MVGVGGEKGYIRLVNARGETIGMTKSWQIPPDTADYIIFEEGDYTVAKNGRTGEEEFEDTDAVRVLENVVNELSDGGYIFIKKGTYNGSSTLTINDTPVVIQGEGQNTVLTFPIEIVGNDPYYTRYIIFRDFKMDATGTQFEGSATGISTTYIQRCVFENIIIRNFKIGIQLGDHSIGNTLRNVWFYGGQTKYALQLEANFNVIDKCWIWYTQNGVNIVGDTQGTKILNSNFEHITNAAILFPDYDAGYNPRWTTVRGCWFEQVPYVYSTEGTRALLFDFTEKENTYASGITEIFHNVYVRTGCDLSTAFVGGSRTAPLEPNNTPGFYTFMWCKIPSGTSLSAGLNVFNFYTKATAAGNARVDVAIQSGADAVGAPFVIWAEDYGHTAADRVRVYIYVDRDVTLSADLVFTLRLSY